MNSIKLKSILSPDVFSVTPETPLSEALSILSEKKISCVLVVENNKPVGILTERDVVKIAACGSNKAKMKLAEVMSSPVKTVQSGMDIVEGYAVLRECKIRHLIVTDEKGTVEGIITHANIIRELKALLTDARTVFEIMTREIFISNPDDTIHEISRKMTENSISCIIIEDDSKPVGIITERDIARVFLSRVDVSAERVNNWMSSPVHMINSNLSLSKALDLMSQKKHRRLIVHDNNGKTIGIVTQSDIVRGMFEANYLRDLRASLEIKELALHKSEKRYQKLFTNMVNGFALHEIVLNEDNKPVDYIFLEVNDTFESMTGLKRSEIIGKKVTEVLFGIMSDSVYLKNVYGKVALTGEGTRLEQKSETLGKWYSVNIYRPQENQLAVILEEITERKKIEFKLKDSEKKSRVWLECSPVCTKIVDLDFNLLYMSAAGVKALKIDDVSQLYGKPYPFDFFPESFRNLMIKNLEKAKETGEIIAQEVPLVDVEGNKLWFHSTLIPVNDDEGRTEHIIVVSVDTTARREAEEDLRKLTNAIEHSVESIVITDFEGTIEYVNPAFEKITEYSKSEVLGENIRIVKSGLHDRAFYKSMWDTINSGEVWRGEIVNKKKSGEIFNERMSISPVFDNDGNIGNFVAIKEDVTREKKLQQQLFQSEKLSSIGTFISGVAHELNNPLTAVLGFSEVLMDDKSLSNNVRRDLEKVATQSERAAKIVKNLLKFSRENKEGKLVVNINDILESTLILKEYHFKTGNVEVTKDFAENLPPVFVDGNQIQQVFMNILLNAFHSMTEANIKGEIKIKTVSKDNEIKIIIENDGPPIPEDMLEKIFNAFFTTKKVGKGTGLGLYVSFGILKEHGGSIRVENIKGSGVRFIICLPVTDKITRVAKEEKVKIILPENIKILVVDDEEVIRDWLKKLLTKKASRVFLAENGKKAIEILKGEKVDVILSDSRMPVCSGLELGEWLKNNKPAYLKKLILLTGAIDQQISDFCSLNRCDYLQKPLQGNVIIEKIYETYKR